MENAIFISFDDHYANHAYTCIRSIKKHYPNHPKILINYVGEKGLPDSFLDDTLNCELIFLNISPPLLENIHLGPVNSPNVFTRYLLWTEAFDRFDKILHLDVDTLVLSPLDAIFEPEDFFVVSDHSNTPKYRVFKPESFRNEELLRLLKEDNIKLPEGQDDMVNAGVFMIPRKYRNQYHYSKLWELTRRYNTHLLFADQSAISLWCHYNGIEISKQYEFNFQVPFVYSDSFFYDNYLTQATIARIKILHFCWWKPEQEYYNTFKLLAENFIRLDEEYQSIADKRYSLKDLSVVISVKAESNDRLVNLNFIFKYFEYYFKDYEIIVVEQDYSSKLSDLVLERVGVKHLFLQSEGCHYKTRNLNLGASVSNRPIIMICDCDIICKPEAIILSIEKLKQGSTFISPHNGITAQIKKHFFKEKPSIHSIVKQLPFFPKDYDVRINDFDYSDFEPLYGNSNYDTSGGAIFCDKEALAKIGGWNTNFISYGYEDMEFIYRIKKLGYPLEKLNDFNLYHFEHERTTDSMLNNFYRSNEREWENICSMTSEELRNYALNGFKKIILDNRKEFYFCNSREEYSLKLINSSKVDLQDISVVVPVSFNNGHTHKVLKLFLDNFEASYNNYQIILIEYNSREFKYPDNLKNLKYFWLNKGEKESAINLGIKQATTTYIAVWELDCSVAPQELEKSLELVRVSATEAEKVPDLLINNIRIMRSENQEVN